MDALPDRRSNPYSPKKYGGGERVKAYLQLFLDRLPWLGARILRIWRAIKWWFWKCRWGMVRLTAAYDRKIDIDKVYWVSPRRIVYSALQEFNICDFKGRVLGGDWDHLEKRFEALDVYIAFKQVFLEGKPWAATVFYQRACAALETGDILWGCRTQGEFDQRCRELEALFYKIQREGYKSQAALMQSQGVYNPMQMDEEVIVSIGRQGDLLFSDGAHRLAIAKLLGIQKIPVKVAVRHLEWVEMGVDEQVWMAQIESESEYIEAHDDESL